MAAPRRHDRRNVSESLHLVAQQRSPFANSMEDDAKKQARIATLHEEMDGLHFVNSLYWGKGEAVISEERAAHQRRADLLDEIRKELARLTRK